MQESGRPFDHDWGPLIDHKDFESIPMFHCELMDSDINGFMDLDESMESSSSEMEFKGSIAERRAAKFGFDASRINVTQFRICNSPPSSSPASASCSPFLTIPPGISPAALLESPVMLPNSQPSPTTGTFPLASCNHDHLTAKPVGSSGTDEGKDCVFDAKLKCPDYLTTQMPCASGAENQVLQSSKSPSDSKKSDASIKGCDMSKSTKTVDMTWDATDIDKKPCNREIADTQMPRLRQCIKKETVAQNPLGEDQKGTGHISTTPGMTRNAEDGYCWRKYGQKHVKGSEYPRSYYKCNNSNCPVKKKVERSHDGEITEIIYKGAHNHPKPQPRLSLGRQASTAEMLETNEGIGSCPKVEGGAGWRYNQLNTRDFKVNSDWRAYGLERTSSASFLNEISDPISISQGKSGSVFGSVENLEIGSALLSHEGEDEDGATQGSTSPADDADGDESEPKRRKKEIFSAEAYLPSRSTREPRIILQIESEIDVLDDGYRWRKYGQKVVKGNPNPRSYYKCTSAGCPVRKHVERASEDIKSVITTYEGKHNHEVPTAKTNGTTSLGNSPPNVSDPHSILTLPRNHNISNPAEMQVQDLSLHYQIKPNDFSQTNLLGDLVSDMKLGASSIYQMKFPPLQSPMPYSPFMMNSNRRETQTHTSCIAAPVVMPEFPMAAVPMSIPRTSANVAVSSSSSNSFQSNNYSRINGSVQSSIGNQQIKENDLRFFKPKEEQKDDHLYESCLATPSPPPPLPPDNANATSSTVFCRGIGKFPPTN